jgi:hypothetical protein
MDGRFIAGEEVEITLDVEVDLNDPWVERNINSKDPIEYCVALGLSISIILLCI